MKKIYYLIAMAMMAFTFTSCEDEQVLVLLQSPSMWQVLLPMSKA